MMSFCAYLSQGQSKISIMWGWIPILLFTIVFGLRYGVGIDYNNYLDVYEWTDDYSYPELIEKERFESGFLLITYICHFLDMPPYIFFSIFSFLQIFIIYETFKNEGNTLIFIYLTLLLSGVAALTYASIIRQIVAACIFLYSLKFVCDNKLLKYWLCCFIAFTFHHSALILFPLYFIWIRKKGILNNPFYEMVILILCVCSVFITGWQSLITKFDNFAILLGYEGYIDRAESLISGGGRSFGFYNIFELAVFSIIVINSRNLKDYFNTPLFNIIYDVFYIGTCLAYIFKGSLLLDRMIIYFTNTQYIMIAYLLNYLYQNKMRSYAHFLKYSFLILFICMQYGRFIYYGEQNTGAYVSYFQSDMHQIKDNLREDALSGR